MAVYNIDENLTPVLLSAMRTCFMSHLLVLVLALVLVLLQLVSTTTLRLHSQQQAAEALCYRVVPPAVCPLFVVR